ncbi:MAG: hypothetical protein ACYC7A_01515 [Thermoanaerobaculia bacterium]
MHDDTLARLALTSLFLAVVSLVPAHLALTDIGHGEPDVSLEWWFLRGTAGLILVAAGFGFAAALRLLRRQV